MTAESNLPAIIGSSVSPYLKAFLPVLEIKKEEINKSIISVIVHNCSSFSDHFHCFLHSEMGAAGKTSRVQLQS